MYMWELFRDHWMLIGAAFVSLWFLTASLIPASGQRNDDATNRARAERAREYQRLRKTWLR